jgi:hypothetical protein
MRSWIILIVATLILVVVLYPIIKRPLWSALAASAIFTVGFQLYARWNLGYMDPFWPIAAVVSGAASFAIALGAIFAWRHLVEQRRRERGR